MEKLIFLYASKGKGEVNSINAVLSYISFYGFEISGRCEHCSQDSQARALIRGTQIPDLDWSRGDGGGRTR